MSKRDKPLKPGTIPTIPLGALIPKGSKNIMVAGRCLSSDRLANSGLRVQAPCMAMGQAAAATAALAAKTGKTPSQVPLADIHALLREHGADIIDVSSGQTVSHEEPDYGRMFQTPFSDRIRNEAGLATMAVGNIYEPDHVNSILMAGRADLVCLARPHLADPYWTLHAATALGDRQEAWPLPYEAGRDQAWRLAEREAEMALKV